MNPSSTVSLPCSEKKCTWWTKKGVSPTWQRRNALTHLSFPSNKEGEEGRELMIISNPIHRCHNLQSANEPVGMEPKLESSPPCLAPEMGSADADSFGGRVQAGAPNGHGIHRASTFFPGSWSWCHTFPPHQFAALGSDHDAHRVLYPHCSIAVPK